jgi:hypothetical protein
MGNRLGVSHVWCWEVAHKYRRGQIPLLPNDEARLLELRDSMGRDPVAVRRAAAAAASHVVYHQGCECPACLCPESERVPYPNAKDLPWSQRCQCVAVKPGWVSRSRKSFERRSPQRARRSS